MTSSLKKILLILPISLLLVAGCGGDDDPNSGADDATTSDSGSEEGTDDSADDGSGDEGSDEGSSGGLDTSDLCGLVSDETLTASNLSTSDGVQKEWVGDQACVYGENLARRIIAQVDPDYSLGPIEEGDDKVEMVGDTPVEVQYDSEMTCLLVFTSGQAKVAIIVEDLFDTEETPGEPCDAGYAALEDVLAKVS